jgi:hypothetical protein
MMTNFKRYVDTLTGDIVEFTPEAAALFDHLKLVPSERAKEKEAAAPAKVEVTTDSKKDDSLAK